MTCGAFLEHLEIVVKGHDFLAVLLGEFQMDGIINIFSEIQVVA